MKSRVFQKVNICVYITPIVLGLFGTLLVSCPVSTVSNTNQDFLKKAGNKITVLSYKEPAPLATGTAIAPMAPVAIPDKATGAYEIVKGALPTGLDLDTTTGAISGTPIIVTTVETKATVKITGNGSYFGTAETEITFTQVKAKKVASFLYNKLPILIIGIAIIPRIPTVTPTGTTGTYKIVKGDFPRGIYRLQNRENLWNTNYSYSRQNEGNN
jgi:hypothetical protein